MISSCCGLVLQVSICPNRSWITFRYQFKCVKMQLCRKSTVAICGLQNRLCITRSGIYLFVEIIRRWRYKWLLCVSLYFIFMLDQWRITVPEGEKVRLTFTSFDLVPDVCGDYVQVYDGDKAGSSLLGKHDIKQVSSIYAVWETRGRRLCTMNKRWAQLKVWEVVQWKETLESILNLMDQSMSA